LKMEQVLLLALRREKLGERIKRDVNRGRSEGVKVIHARGNWLIIR
jgi:hypothetical protein